MKITTTDEGVLVETETSESFTPRVTQAERDEAARVFAETGCVPEDYHRRAASGYLIIRGS
jgi:hypothetical protein